MNSTREQEILAAFVSLTDGLVRGFDVVDLLEDLTQICVRLLDVTTTGILLADERGSLQVAASSDETTRHLELLQVDDDAGPCLECWATGQLVEVADLTNAPSRWATFSPVAVAAGFRSICAVPLRLRTETIGTVNLLRRDPGILSAHDRRLARALADVATIALIQHRVISENARVTDQLDGALVSQIIIEQAKGLLAERAGIGFDDALDLLRRFARARGERLEDVAQSFVDSTTTLADLRSGSRVARIS